MSDSSVFAELEDRRARVVNADIFQLQDVTDEELAYPLDVEHLMPKYLDIPSEFKDWSRNRWAELFSQLFYGDVKGLCLVRKRDVDAETAERAWRQMDCIRRSWSPKHEHKAAACAYILSCYFDDYSFDESGQVVNVAPSQSLKTSIRIFARRAKLALATTVLFLTGCAAHAVPHVSPAAPGFWLGYWHGLIAPIAFIVSLFNHNVAVYAVPNKGRLYDWGFLLGIGVFARAARAVAKRRQ
jgi:hypothetical protein